MEEREVAQDLEDRDEPQLVGDHQRREHEHEQQLATREAQARERVAAERAEEEVGQRDGDREDSAVREVAGEVDDGS